MRRALDEYYVEGIRTNLGLFKTILRFPDFLEGRLDTELIDRLLAPFHEAPHAAGRGTGLAHEQSAPVGRILSESLEQDRQRAVALAAVLFETARHHSSAQSPAPPDAAAARSDWKLEGRRRLLRQPSSRFRS